jgi:hypothetical protein
MAERTDQLTETRSVDHEVDLEESGKSQSGRGRVRERAGSLFSPTRFLIALVLITVGMFVGGTTLPFVGGVAGAFLGAFLLGVASKHRPMAEAGTAGAVVLGLSTAFDYLVWVIIGSGLTIAALGAVFGLILGALGAYFGSDLRNGLTRDI